MKAVINGVECEGTPEELSAFRAAMEPAPPVVEVPKPQPVFVQPPVITPSAPVPSHHSEVELNQRKKLEDKGYHNTGNILATLRVLVDESDVLNGVQTNLVEYMMQLPRNEINEINLLTSLVRQQFPSRSKRKAWVPGIVAATLLIKMEGDDKQYEKMLTRFRINTEFVEHVFNMNHEVFKEWALLEAKRARLNPRARRALFEDMYLLFTDKNLRIGNTA